MARNQGVWLTGRLTKDAVFKTVGSAGTPVSNFTVAVDRDKKEGEDGKADFPAVVCWRKVAEKCNGLKKGATVLVIGTIQTRSYEGNNGKVYVTEVLADRVFIDGGAQKKRDTGNTQDDLFGDEVSDFTPLDEDDLPF